MDKNMCILCDPDNSKLLLDKLEGKYQILKCQTCGLACLNPWPSPEELDVLYPKEYWWHESEKQNIFTKLERSYRNYLLSAEIDRITDITPKNGKILDVGCGNGDILGLCKAKDFDAYGVETAKQAVEYARRKNKVNVFCGELQDAKFEMNYFDIVIFYHALEHLSDPISTLKEAYRILKDRGNLIIQVPNIESYQFKLFKRRWFGLQVPSHLYHFSPRALRLILGETGFEITQINHFSLRCNPMMFTSSLFPNLNPHAFLEKTSKGKGQTINKLICFILTIISVPLVLLESLLGHGATITVFAKKISCKNE